jgi:hypothetical protein
VTKARKDPDKAVAVLSGDTRAACRRHRRLTARRPEAEGRGASDSIGRAFSGRARRVPVYEVSADARQSLAPRHDTAISDELLEAMAGSIGARVYTHAHYSRCRFFISLKIFHGIFFRCPLLKR